MPELDRTPAREADYYNRDKKMPCVHEALAQRIHDHAIDHALYRFAQPKPHQRRPIIGVMGGHSKTRADEIYHTVTHLTWQLSKKAVSIVSGGGPGVMEAANLGAYLSSYESAAVDESVEILKKKSRLHEANGLHRGCIRGKKKVQEGQRHEPRHSHVGILRRANWPVFQLDRKILLKQYSRRRPAGHRCGRNRICAWLGGNTAGSFSGCRTQQLLEFQHARSDDLSRSGQVLLEIAFHL